MELLSGRPNPARALAAFKTLAVAVLAIIAVAGADWAKGIDVASLRVLQVEQPF